MFVCLSVCLRAFLPSCLSIYLSIYLSICLSLNIRRNFLFLHDAVPPRFTYIARNYLEAAYRKRWIGRQKPASWPTRSPDLNPLDFPPLGRRSFSDGYCRGSEFELVVPRSATLSAFFSSSVKPCIAGLKLE
jgi:hypothetical protein